MNCKQVSITSRVLTANGVRTMEEPRGVNMDTKSLVNPSRNIDTIEKRVARSIMGLRRPKRDFEWSAMTPVVGSLLSPLSEEKSVIGISPIRGWTTSPERGPASSAIEIKERESPSDSKYGVAVINRALSVNQQSSFDPHVIKRQRKHCVRDKMRPTHHTTTRQTKKSVLQATLPLREAAVPMTVQISSQRPPSVLHHLRSLTLADRQSQSCRINVDKCRRRRWHTRLRHHRILAMLVIVDV